MPEREPEPPRRADSALSHHILPSAATMVGICPTLIGVVKLTEANGVTRRADEIIGLLTVVFVASALTSYAAIRSGMNRDRSQLLERAADLFFVVGLLGLALVSLLFAYEWV